MIRRTIQNKKNYINDDFMLQKDENGVLFYDINFCPYCRTLILEDGDIEVTNSEGLDTKANAYLCNACKRTFSINNLKRQSKQKHLPYKLSENCKLKGTTEKHIKRIVKEYHKKGYSYRRIRELSCFSLEKVQQCIQIQKDYADPIICTKKELLNKYLEINENVLVNDKVIKAWKFGCTYKVIEKLFRVSSKTITKVLNANKKREPLYVVSLIENKYIVKKKK